MEERGKVHLNLQAEEAQVLLDTNWIIYWNNMLKWSEGSLETFDYKGKIEVFEPSERAWADKKSALFDRHNAIIMSISTCIATTRDPVISGCWDSPSVHLNLFFLFCYFQSDQVIVMSTANIITIPPATSLPSADWCLTLPPLHMLMDRFLPFTSYQPLHYQCRLPTLSMLHNAVAN